MKLFCRSFLLLVALLVLKAAAQVPLATGVQILKAEDARRYDSTLKALMKSSNADIRKRAALASGRIGNVDAVPVLADLLAEDKSTDVRAMAAFALGEIESIAGADAIIKVLDANYRVPAAVLARAVEAGGKIAAANAKDEKAKVLGSGITKVLKSQADSPSPADSLVVSLGLTALLRVRPEGADAIAAKFLVETDPRLRADAANTLARLRSKGAAETLRKIVTSDNDPDARANAARALGTMVDKNSLNELLSAAVEDGDLRVRVSAIRALANLNDPRAAKHLIERGEKLLVPTHADPAPIKPGKRVGDLKPVEAPLPKCELLEIAAALGRLLPGTSNEDAIVFLNKVRMADSFSSPETEIALAQVAPKEYVQMRFPGGFAYRDWHMAAAYAQGMAEIGKSKDAALLADAGMKLTEYVAGMATQVKPRVQAKMMLAMPELTTALAALRPDNLDDILRGQLKNADVFVRAAAASAIADQPHAIENVEALNAAYSRATLTDKHDNDAKLAILDALAKLDKKAGVGTFLTALNDNDYLIRKKAFDLLDDKSLQTEFPGIPTSLENGRTKHKDEVLPFASYSGSKLGQVLNTDIDYRRALSRKNGSVKAVLTTEKGIFTIEFFSEEAPLTVDNFIKLARAGYFNGLEVHRVVPNFVMQDGDPRGDGNGGPGWSIRCEINMLPYDRGAVGMALSGKDTGGSQWFVTHSPQPHLDGGYTVFGHVNETDMSVVDNIMRGDRILTVKIVEDNLPQRTPRKN